MERKLYITTSWDDGHILDLKLAELLKKYGLRGTFYVSPEDREISAHDRLTDDQVRELSLEYEIGAHTMTHPHLTKVDIDNATKEIIDSKAYIEKVTGKRVTSFCYPAGFFNEQCESIVKAAGFTYARTVNRFAFRLGANPFAAPTTIHAYRHWSDALPILREVGLKRFLACYLHWDELAITLFDQAPDGGVFHLWGHSWEVEKNGDWARLERVFAHIAHKKNAEYLSNADLV